MKDSPQNTLVFVTRLDTGAPVANAEVAIVRVDNSTAWNGKTDDHGIAIAPQVRVRNPRQPHRFSFLVTAAKDGDVAYVGSDWNEGIEPYFFETPYDISEAEPLLRGTVFSDRGRVQARRRDPREGGAAPRYALRHPGDVANRCGCALQRSRYGHAERDCGRGSRRCGEGGIGCTEWSRSCSGNGWSRRAHDEGARR